MRVLASRQLCRLEFAPKHFVHVKQGRRRRKHGRHAAPLVHTPRIARHDRVPGHPHGQVIRGVNDCQAALAGAGVAQHAAPLVAGDSAVLDIASAGEFGLKKFVRTRQNLIGFPKQQLARVVNQPIIKHGQHVAFAHDCRNDVLAYRGPVLRVSEIAILCPYAVKPCGRLCARAVLGVDLQLAQRANHVHSELVDDPARAGVVTFQFAPDVGPVRPLRRRINAAFSGGFALGRAAQLVRPQYVIFRLDGGCAALPQGQVCGKLRLCWLTFHGLE